MSEILILVKEAAKAVGLSESTVKKYMNKVEKFSSYRMERSNDGKLVFSELDINLLRTVNKLKKMKGYTVDVAIRQAISDILGLSDDPNQSNGSSTELVDMSDVKNGPDMSVRFNVISDKIDKVICHNQELENQNKEQAEFNKFLVEKLDHQERYIRESLERRDQALLESIRALQEEKKALIEVAAATAAAVKEDPKKKIWWKFWE
ncbi:MerR family transcriptional regulator [Bacillus sp. EB600]|uniref:MerR family transcriptional regulator n=1 Tax=Bacillus sp. EB600 TaxID=2806345 RepID=UPI002109A985|nr:MerR family transcriptional regulator [Bacillus sp. EB600]MCQ6281648.1 MerR family transcriptional regulator [Bacillus sp. EB600]